MTSSAAHSCTIFKYGNWIQSSETSFKKHKEINLADILQINEDVKSALKYDFGRKEKINDQENKQGSDMVTEK